MGQRDSIVGRYLPCKWVGLGNSGIVPKGRAMSQPWASMGVATSLQKKKIKERKETSNIFI